MFPTSTDQTILFSVAHMGGTAFSVDQHGGQRLQDGRDAIVATAWAGSGAAVSVVRQPNELNGRIVVGRMAVVGARLLTAENAADQNANAGPAREVLIDPAVEKDVEDRWRMELPSHSLVTPWGGRG